VKYNSYEDSKKNMVQENVTQDSGAPSFQQPERDYIGFVKWFNNQKGYGFVRILTSGERYEQDVFVHQSNVQTQHDRTYRSLVPSECVVFNLGSLDSEGRPQATEVTGVNGSLFCDRKARREHLRRTRRQEPSEE
jgi:cold shock CspA family protein